MLDSADPVVASFHHGFTRAELRLLAYFVRVSEQFIPRNHDSYRHIAAMLARIDQTCGCSLERTSQQCGVGELKADNRIGTREAARLIGCTTRAVQQRIRRGTLRADRIGRTYLIDPEDL